jgi:molecular chaperone DnaK
MYTAQAAAAENAAGGQQSESAADDVVDAEFEEVKDNKK